MQNFNFKKSTCIEKQFQVSRTVDGIKQVI